MQGGGSLLALAWKPARPQTFLSLCEARNMRGANPGELGMGSTCPGAFSGRCCILSCSVLGAPHYSKETPTTYLCNIGSTLTPNPPSGLGACKPKGGRLGCRKAEPRELQGVKAGHPCLRRHEGAFIPLPAQQLLFVLQEPPLQLCVAGSLWEAAQPPEGPCAN